MRLFTDEEVSHTPFFNVAKKSKSKAQVSFGSGYGTPTDLWMQAVDNSQAYLLHYAKKTKDILGKAVISTSNAELKLHYMFLLKRLKDSLEK